MVSAADIRPYTALEFTAFLAIALALHGSALALLPHVGPGRGLLRKVMLVDVEVLETEIEAPPPPELDAEEPIKLRKHKWKKPKTHKAPKREIAPEEPPAAAEETPISFDNIVLTNESVKKSWELEESTEKDNEAPIGSPDAAVTGARREGIAGGVIGGSGRGTIVELGDLSRAPSPPPLRRKLERLFPKKARSEGREGEAVVRLHVQADGMPEKLRLVREQPEAYGFGNACLRTLRSERWQAPIDQSGQRVATIVTYTCRFVIRH